MGDTRVYDVVVLGFRGNGKTTPAQVLEDILGVEPAQARALVRQYPSTIIKRTTLVHAQIAADQLREAGARVEVLESDAARSQLVAGAVAAGGVSAVASSARAQVPEASELGSDTGTFDRAAGTKTRSAPANQNARAPKELAESEQPTKAKVDRARALTLNVKAEDSAFEVETSQRRGLVSERATADKATAPAKPERQRALTLNAKDDDLHFELDKGFPTQEAHTGELKQPEAKASFGEEATHRVEAPKDRSFALTFNLSQPQKPADMPSAPEARGYEKSAKSEPSAKSEALRESAVSPEMLFDQARLREMAKSLESPDFDAFFNGDKAPPPPAAPAKSGLDAKLKALDEISPKPDLKSAFDGGAFGSGAMGPQAFGSGLAAAIPGPEKAKPRVEGKAGSAAANDLFVPLAAVKEGKAPAGASAVDKAGSRMAPLENRASVAHKSPYGAKEKVEIEILKPKKTGLQQAFESTAVKLSAAVATFAVAGSVAFSVMNKPAVTKESLAHDPQKAKAVEMYRGRALPSLHAFLRLAPASWRAPIARILRERVSGAYLVEMSWEQMPADAQCFLISPVEGKGNERESKLRETGVVVSPPEEETEEAFREHEEAMRLAHGLSGWQPFKRLCLSTSEYDLMVLANAEN